MRALRLTLLFLAFTSVCFARDEFDPIPQDELTMKEYPGSQGASAVILEREILTDDIRAMSTYYYRIKILTEDGKKYADVEIPYPKEYGQSINDIRARTVHADGTAIPFNGKVFEKTIVKIRQFKYLAKTFTLPDVQVGSVIEYKYTLHWDSGWVLSGTWIIQSDLLTRHARFNLKPAVGFDLSYSWFELSKAEVPKSLKDGSIQVELRDIPAFVKEDYALPERDLKIRLEYFYNRSNPKSMEEFWKQKAKYWNEIIERFIGKSKTLERAANEIAPTSDPFEARLRKLYTRTQQVRNLSYERLKSEKEEKKEHLGENSNAEDVFKHGYGDHSDINLLLVALARAAGFQAALVRVSERDDHIFHANVLSDHQFDGTLVVVQNGKDQIYLDPGTFHCPYGLLPWAKTSTAAMWMDKDGGKLANTVPPKSSDSITERKASLELGDDGALRGKAQVVFHGQEALRRRIEARDDDELTRSKDLEDEIKSWFPVGGNVKLDKVTGWEGIEEPLEADFTIELPGYVSRAGRRILLPVGLFEGGGSPFEHANRVHSIYFSYPYQDLDDVTIKLPQSLAVESLPAKSAVNPGDFCGYEATRDQDANTLHLKRRFAMNGITLDKELYPSFRHFYQKVKSGDEEQAVLKPMESRASQ